MKSPRALAALPANMESIRSRMAQRWSLNSSKVSVLSGSPGLWDALDGCAWVADEGRWNVREASVTKRLDDLEDGLSRPVSFVNERERNSTAEVENEEGAEAVFVVADIKAFTLWVVVGLCHGGTCG